MGFYAYDTPVVGPPLFAGREMLLRSLRDGLDRGRSLILCGGPKSGRTSTLGRVQALLRERWQRQPQTTKLVPVFIDLAQCGLPSLARLAKAIWEATASALRDSYVTGEAVPPPLADPAFLKSRQPLQDLLAAIAALSKSTEGTAAWCRQTWLIDNADALFMRDQADALSIFAQAAGGKLAGGPSSVLFAGGRLLRESLFERQSPLRGTRPLFLGTFKESEAAQLIHAGLPDTPPDLAAELMRLSGRHPYALERLLAALEEVGPQGDLTAVVEVCKKELEALFNAIWEEFDLNRGLTYRGAYASPEHAFMQLVLDSAGGVSIDTAESQLGIKPLREFAEMLEYVGVVERSLRNDEPRLRAQFGLFNEWYCERIRY